MQPASSTARDDVYCHFVARKAVARAALCVGVESMSQQTLDALTGVLLAYLERVGSVLASSVQVSGRSSAHVNVLDALRATEQCTAAAVQRVQLVSGSAGSAGASAIEAVAGIAGDGGANDWNVGSHQFQNNITLAQDKSWKGLAAFCFGPDWHVESVDANAAAGESMNMASASSAGGKVGPASLLKKDGSIKETQAFRGWNAPYPDEVPPFPLVLGDAPVANPHALPEHVGESLHAPDVKQDKNQEEMTAELEALPDSLFNKEWGTITGSPATKKRTADDMETDDDDNDKADSTIAKKLRFAEDEAASGVMETDIPEDRAFIPYFFPEFPKPTATMSRTVLERVVEIQKASTATAAERNATRSPSRTDPTLKVRSALVSLDKNDYWGSSWQNQDGADAVVPPGRSEQAGVVQPLIVPLGRASGSRVSKILEGSMEPPAPV